MIVKNFKKSREEMELKQKDIASFFNLNFTTISGWETGKDTIPLYRLIAYANHYNYSLDYLFGLTNKNIQYSNIIIDLNLLAINLRNLRKKNHMTQIEVATRLNTTQAAYSHYENGIYMIATTFLYGLTKIYKSFSIDELFNRKRSY